MTAEKNRNKTEVKTSLGFDPDMWKQFQIRCIERGVLQKTAMHEALELWMRPQPLAVAPEYENKFIECVMQIVNDPRNETEKILRNLLKQVVHIRYIANETVTPRR